MSEFTREYFIQQGKRGARKRWANATQKQKDDATRKASEARRIKLAAKLAALEAFERVSRKARFVAKRNGKGGK